MINPLVALGVFLSTAAMDTAYIFYTSAVVQRRKLTTGLWSSLWYLMSAFAVISYTQNWVYVLFAAAGAWVGCFISVSILQWQDNARDRAKDKQAQ